MDGLGGGTGEGLRAVTALQHERLSAGHRGQPVPKQVAFAGEDERRQSAQLTGNGLQPGRVRPVRLLSRWQAVPAGQAGGPGSGRGHARAGPAAASMVAAATAGCCGGLAHPAAAVSSGITVSRYAPDAAADVRRGTMAGWTLRRQLPARSSCSVPPARWAPRRPTLSGATLAGSPSSPWPRAAAAPASWPARRWSSAPR